MMRKALRECKCERSAACMVQNALENGFWRSDHIMLKNCPVCGKRISSEAVFCPECGFDFRTLPPVNKQPVKKGRIGAPAGRPEKSERPGLFRRLPKPVRILIGVLIGALVLLSAAVLVLFRVLPAFAKRAPYRHPASDEMVSAYLENVSANASVPEDVQAIFCGSWKGADGSGFTFYPDGTAVYYSSSGLYSEAACPWRFADGRLTVKTTRLCCDIYADVGDGSTVSNAGAESGSTVGNAGTGNGSAISNAGAGNDSVGIAGEELPESLYFVSDSRNWVAESFTRLPKEDPTYLRTALSNYDVNLAADLSGRPHSVFDGLEFTFPKRFMDHPDAHDKSKDVVILSNTDADRMHFAGIAAKYEDHSSFDAIDQFFEGEATYFLSGFMSNLVLSEIEPCRIAGIPSFRAHFSGRWLRSFGSLTGNLQEGIVVLVCNEAEGRALWMLLSQSEEVWDVYAPEFEEVLSGAQLSDEGRTLWGV